MKTLILSFTLIVLFACDSPQTSRRSRGAGYNQDVQDSIDSTNAVLLSDEESSSLNQSTSKLGCNYPKNGSATSLGSIAICQDSQDELAISFIATLSSGEDDTCLVPVYKDPNSGASFYIGHAECTQYNANEVKSGSLAKDRAGAQATPLNAVMVIKRAIVQDYFRCMNAESIFLSETNNHLYFAQANCNGKNVYECASVFKEYVCSEFVQLYKGKKYVEISLR